VTVVTLVGSVVEVGTALVVVVVVDFGGTVTVVTLVGSVVLVGTVTVVFLVG
jgi:hypothetical protein